MRLPYYRTLHVKTAILFPTVRQVENPKTAYFLAFRTGENSGDMWITDIWAIELVGESNYLA